MNVNEIIWHLENFQNTWNGWNGLISGLTDFFRDNPVQKFADLFANDAENLKAAFEPLSSIGK